jgi:hypothetical protein
MKTIRSSLWLATCLAIVLAAATDQARALSSDANLVDLIRLSQTIISGTVSSVADGIDARGIPYTEVSLEIDESIKGQATGSYTFRQFGLMAPRPAGEGRVMMPAPLEFPRFTSGEKVLLFLPPPAAWSGLQTSVGLEAGKFTINPGRAENGNANQGVFQSVSLDPGLAVESDLRIFATEIGAVNPDSLSSLVRRAVQGQWVETCQMWDTAEGKTCRVSKPAPPAPRRPKTPDATPDETPVLNPDLDY